MFVRTPEDLGGHVTKKSKEEDLDQKKVGTNCILINDGLDDTSFVDAEGDRWYTDEYGDQGGGMDYMWNY